MSQSLVTFPAYPENFIEIDDLFSGQGRILVRVFETGSEYLDIDEGVIKPLPILSSLNPIEIGDVRTLQVALMNNTEVWFAFSTFIDEVLTIRPTDSPLFFMRAIKWGYDNKVFDAGQAINAAIEATRSAEMRKVLLEEAAMALTN